VTICLISRARDAPRATRMAVCNRPAVARTSNPDEPQGPLEGNTLGLKAYAQKLGSADIRETLGAGLCAVIHGRSSRCNRWQNGEPRIRNEFRRAVCNGVVAMLERETQLHPFFQMKCSPNRHALTTAR